MSEGVRGCAREFHIVLKGRVCKRVWCHLYQQKAAIVTEAVDEAVAVTVVVSLGVTLAVTAEVQVCVVCYERPPWFSSDERSDGCDRADRTTP